MVLAGLILTTLKYLFAPEELKFITYMLQLLGLVVLQLSVLVCWPALR